MRFSIAYSGLAHAINKIDDALICGNTHHNDYFFALAVQNYEPDDTPSRSIICLSHHNRTAIERGTNEDGQ